MSKSVNTHHRPTPKMLLRLVSTLIVALAAFSVLATLSAPAQAQSDSEIVDALDRDGYYIADGAEGSHDRFAQLAAQQHPERWYFVSLNGTLKTDKAQALRAQVAKEGNVLVFSSTNENAYIDLASSQSAQVNNSALDPFDTNWATPSELMGKIVAEYDSLTTGSTQKTKSGPTIGGFLLPIVLISAIFGFVFYKGRQTKKRRAKKMSETATKMRTEIVKELEELANDVLVLSSQIELSDNEEAVSYYREAAAAYIELSDELPEVEELKADLEKTDLAELTELGSEVSTARWQMDCAEALLTSEPLPPKPQVTTPAPEPLPQPRPPIPQQRVPQRQPHPRVSYQRSGNRGGAGLIDILVAGATLINDINRRNRRRTPRPPTFSQRRGGGFSVGTPRPRRSGSGGVLGSPSSSRTSSSSSSRTSAPRPRPGSSASRSKPRGGSASRSRKR